MNTNFPPPLSAALYRAAPLRLTASLILPDGGYLTGGESVTSSPLVLVGRSEGRRLFPLLAEQLEALPPRSILPLDLGEVGFADISYCDESFTKLARRRAAGEYPERYIVLIGIRPDLESNLEVFFAARNIALPIRRSLSGSVESERVNVQQDKSEGEPDLLGEVGPEMRDTYRFAVRAGRITARSLIEELGEERLAIAASSNRLTRLVERGALASIGSEIVETGGRQKVFVPVS